MVNNTINFSIAKAREVAWANAMILCHAGNTKRNEIINTTDNIVLKVANAITHPSTIKKFSLKIILWFEGKMVAKNIASLRGN